MGKNGYSHLAFALSFSGITWCCTATQIYAQITPDNSLGTESSIVTPNVSVQGEFADLIEGGAIRNVNLFHSFSDFNVGELQRVYFANPSGIQNILTRVTGGNISNILGTLGVDGSANLFLLNPNGIFFGENAQLEITGSFTASTANSFVFGNQGEFSATNPHAPPLLSVNVPLGIQWGSSPHAEIRNLGDLGVGTGETLTLWSTTLAHQGSLTAPGGMVQVLGDYIALSDNALIDVSSETGGGTVLIGGGFLGAHSYVLRTRYAKAPDGGAGSHRFQGEGTIPTAKRTYIGSGVNINADSLTAGDGGTVVVWADEVTAFYGNISARGGIQSGDGGFVEVSGKEYLLFRGTLDTSTVNGSLGILLLDPVNITIANGSGDEAGDGTDTFAGDNSGTPGSILSAPLSSFEDTAPTTIYESELEGLSGDTNIVLQATNDITLENLADDDLNLAPGSGVISLTADADGDGVGDFTMEDTTDTIRTRGRDILISGANLTLGTIDTSTSFIFSGGEAIAVDVDASGAIPETGTSGTAIFTFTAPDIGETIGDLDVIFSAAHTFDSDLDVFLQSPNGTVLTLFSGVGFGEDNFQDTRFDDNAQTNIITGTAPFAGTFQPAGEGGLGVFNGQDIAGVWTLAVIDNFSGDSG